MGKCSSKRLGPSIDVSGNSNYVVMIDAAQFNVTSVLHEIINHINRENRAWILFISSLCILMTVLLIIVLIYVNLLAKHSRTKSHITMRNIKDGIVYLIQRIPQVNSKMDHLSMLLVRGRTNWPPENLGADTYSESSV